VCVGSERSLFFFSSRRRHTRLVSDWSSDVCSSDLYGRKWRLASLLSTQTPSRDRLPLYGKLTEVVFVVRDVWLRDVAQKVRVVRSEERRVGKEGRGGGWACG